MTRIVTFEELGIKFALEALDRLKDKNCTIGNSTIHPNELICLTFHNTTCNHLGNLCLDCFKKRRKCRLNRSVR